MKRILSGILLGGICLLMASGVKHKPCGTYNGHNLYKGEKGGCYYLKGKQKTRIYVDKKHCKC